MQNIIEILKANGLELTEEQITAVNKAVAENYKTVAEFDKKVGKLETERDGYKSQLNEVNETLKGFEGVDLDGMKNQLAEAQKKAEEAEKAFSEKLAKRDFDDALKTAMDNYSFSSVSAKNAIMDEIRSKNLTMVDGKIVGLNEVMDGIKAKDAGAFVDNANPPAQFTAPMGTNPTSKTYSSKDEILKIKDAQERQQAIRDNIGLFVQTK